MSPDYVPNFDHCLLPYVQWYQDDFIGGVRGMRAHEIGIYTMLLMEMYTRGRALDLSTERLARLCGADKRTFEKVLNDLLSDGKIIRLDCGLWNERCENAFRSRAKMQEQQSEAGRASAEKRSGNKVWPQRPLSERSTDVQPSSEAQNIEKEDTSVSSKKRGARLPENWTLPKDWAAWAMAEGLSEFEARREGDKFRDHWHSAAGQRGVKLDWQKAWQNWARKAVDDRASRRGVRGGSIGRDAQGDLTNDFLFGRG